MDDELSICSITFRRSRSPRFQEAIAVARSLPSFKDREECYSVDVTASQLVQAERLLDIVGSWRATTVEADGQYLTEVESLKLRRVLRCYRRKLRLRLGDAYCWGLPELRVGRVPCRVVDAVMPWVPPMPYRDPVELPSLLRALAIDSLADRCPVYNPASVRLAAASDLLDDAGRSAFERLVADVEGLVD
ncbi:MAG: hypothetical protein KC495_02360 [Dehalococcoidia bacterium]|nr:hypothetical protein [Dehalococcoidia bacterium]